MEQTTITPALVKQLISDNYRNRAFCMSLSHALKTHALGLMPENIIIERRPSESEEIKAYRRKIYVPKTKNPISKVISSLEKIRRSQDWSIQYSSGSVPSVVAQGESLEDYCEYKYPYHTSITNWAFSELLREYLLDANGIVAVVLDELPQSSNEYCKPVAKFFPSDNIVSYAEGRYIVLKSSDTSVYHSHNGRVTHTDGAIYYVITPTEIMMYAQVNNKGDLVETSTYVHGIGELPAVRVGGIFKARVNNDTIYESRIAGMIPSLDEAAREYSDLQAEIVQHIHSEKYAYTNGECSVCRGTGKVLDENGKQCTCKVCNGSGSVLNVSPYGIYLVEGARAGENQLPTPPIGYVQKSAEIARLQDERVKQHLYDALSAVNMEFLADRPLSQSGIAKEVDRDELNNFVNSVAEDLVRILDNVYRFICEYRYRHIVTNDIVRRDMLPFVNVPSKYDLLNTNIIMDQLAKARQAGINPILLRALEIDYAKKQFCTDGDVAKMVETCFDLDPLFGISEDAKMVMLNNGGITLHDYIVSCNVHSFVRRAVEADSEFFNRPYEAKMKALQQYADEIARENSTSEQLIADMGDE